MSIDIYSSTAAVPEDIHGILVDGSEVKSKVGHVAKFNNIDDNVSRDDELNSTPVGKIYQFYSNNDQQINNPTQVERSKISNEFVGLTKEQLKCYINNPYWKRIRWIVGISYVLLILFLLIGAIVVVLFSMKCPSKRKLVWYEKEIIYEIDIEMFRDSNGDGQGDIKGVEETINYFEKNLIKTILFRSNIFSKKPKIDLLTLNQQICNEIHLQNFIKIINRKDMHLILDLPLSSTNDPNGYQWYGSIHPLEEKINNPCDRDKSSLACRYSTLYGRLPLDFSKKQVVNQAEFRLRHWLSTRKFDGVRLDLPLEFDRQTGLYNISYKTISRWNVIKNQIEKKTEPKLIFFDVPFGLNDLIIENDLHNKISHPIVTQQSLIDAEQLNERIQSFKFNHLSIPKFWQLGSMRPNDTIQNQLSKQMMLTMGMLFGGTPIVLYGEELGIEQKSNRLMLWTPDKPCGGFSSCVSEDCLRLFSLFNLEISKTNVKREEAVGGEEKDSLLILFRHLSKLRQFDSFQFGLLETGYDIQSNLFWFIREAPGHRGFVVVFNFNEKEEEITHLSLYKLTNSLVPEHISYEYQWPKMHFSTTNKSHIHSDNLFVHPQSINIFYWKPKLIKPNILFKKGKNHLAN